ncbi:MAG: 50S ribosomal protein L10 [Chloroflexi bacterium]|nr:50S ribosomal protein L10 [Chloroflexota bacterium]
MPTQKKITEVEELQQIISGSSIAISTNYAGQSVASMTALRRTLREKGVDYKVVKNTLLGIAADNAGQPTLREIVNGPTGLVFGAGDPTEAAKILVEYIKSSKSTLQIIGGVMDTTTLTPDEVQKLAELPTKPELVALLLRQMQSPIAGLVYVLSAPLSALATVLQRKIEKGDDTPAPAAAEAKAEEKPAEEPKAEAAEPVAETVTEKTESKPVKEAAPEVEQPSNEAEEAPQEAEQKEE